MANIKSAEKRMRQSARRTARNRAVRSTLRTTLKTHRAADDSSKAAAVPSTYSQIDTARRKGVIHRNAAARYKSRLAKRAGKSK
jgi:small subunit ribosomal protein S20